MTEHLVVIVQYIGGRSPLDEYVYVITVMVLCMTSSYTYSNGLILSPRLGPGVVEHVSPSTRLQAAGPVQALRPQAASARSFYYTTDFP